MLIEQGKPLTGSSVFENASNINPSEAVIGQLPAVIKRGVTSKICSKEISILWPELEDYIEILLKCWPKVVMGFITEIDEGMQGEALRVINETKRVIQYEQIDYRNITAYNFLID